MTTTNTSPSLAQLTFVKPIPGLPDYKEWSLAPVGEDSPFMVLTSLDSDVVSFIIVEPGYFFTDLIVDVDDQTQDLLQLNEASDAVLYVILTLGETLETTTANLLGPIVVNVHNGNCVQMIRTQTDDSTKEPLVVANTTQTTAPVEEAASVIVEEVEIESE